MSKNIDKSVSLLFSSYPKNIRLKLMYLRKLILETASESDEVGELEETIKWGQPSYLTKGGSTVRLGWSEKQPDQYAMYFHCQTRLVDTFKELYGSILKTEGNRAILFNLDDEIPVDELKHCILLALTYHQRKHLPMLGV
jgi:hypothetical protein